MDGRGFTLVELLIALALAAAVAVTGIPSLREFLRDCERTATVQALLQAVHSARRLAALSGHRVELCPTRNGEDCSGDLLWDGNLLLRPAPGSELTPRVLPSQVRRPPQTVRANRSALTFAPLRPSATTATITVCDDRGPRAALAIVVSRTGRPRVAARDASGDPWSCP
jgi:type IV fimbrial biogenesis protein FimT